MRQTRATSVLGLFVLTMALGSPAQAQDTHDVDWPLHTGAGVFSSPAVYMVDGEQFVTVVSGGGSRGRRGGDLILSFALPPRR